MTSPHPAASDVIDPRTPEADEVEALPPLDQSFLRWSKTASTLFSEPSNFYFDGRRSTGQFSDSTPPPQGLATIVTPPAPPPPAVPSTGSGPASPQLATDTPVVPRPNMYRRESTNSAGTFGASQRRWSAVHSALSAASEIPLDITTQPRIASNSEDTTATTEGDGEEITGASTRPKQRRPFSMSSASDSTWSGAGVGQVLGGEPRIHIGRSSIPGVTFPSPSLRRPPHNVPETEADITAHLLKASSKSEARIIPPTGPTKAMMANFFGTRSPPTGGTPLRGLREESRLLDRSNQTEKRKTSKLDQILGEGAETARVLMEFDRRAIEDVVQTPGVTRLPPPPRHAHKPSASVSSIPILAPSTPYNLSPARSRFNHNEIYSSPRRSNSMDSIPSSLHPSLTESTHTTARLLPPQTPAPAYALPRVPSTTEPRPEARNDLTPELRAVLLRRARKLEQLLGETLGEVQVDQHVVRPGTAATTILTSHDVEWPSSPGPVNGRKIPEYERQDCQPRIVRELSTNPGGSAPAMAKSATAGKAGSSKMAMKAMAALGIKADKDKKEDDGMRVFVSRERTVLETHTGARPSARDAESSWRLGQTRSSEESGKSSLLDSPEDPVEASWASEEDVIRRNRRLQVAKLYRLLGEPIPSTAFRPLQSNCFDPTTGLPIESPNATQRPSPASELSYFAFDDDQPSPAQTWSKRIQSVVGGSKDRDKDKDKEKKESKREADFGSGKARAKSPPQDRIIGSRDGLEGSFVDMKDAKRVPQKIMPTGWSK